jgi:hypothetical protein
MFNPEAFMQAVITDANSTALTPCPPGEFPAQILEVKPASGTIGKGDRAGQPWARLDVSWEITDPSVAAITGRERTRVRQGVMLDLTASGDLDMSPNQNVRLGQLREAVGLNQAGQAFSPAMFIGRSARVVVKHEIDNRDGVTIQANVVAARPL